MITVTEALQKGCLLECKASGMLLMLHPSDGIQYYSINKGNDWHKCTGTVHNTDLSHYYILNSIPTKLELNAEQSMCSKEEKITKSDVINNGGKTNYYDLPTITDRDLVQLICVKIKEVTPTECRILVDSIRELLPTTLNDLIEYKDMYPFQHEIFKACYALQERANKDIKGGSILRELNKMKYYIERGIDLAKKGKI